MISPEGVQLEKSLKLGFRASNYDTEYEALISGLKVIQQLSAEEVEVFSDSKLVVSQIEKSFEAKDSRMFGALQAAFSESEYGQDTEKSKQSCQFIGHFGFIIG